MNSIHPPFNPAAEEQASLWAARLDGSVLSSSDRVKLEKWLAAHSGHRELLSHYCQFSADLEQSLPILVAANAVDLPTAPVRRSSWLKWSAPLALAAAAAVAFVVWVKPAPEQANTVVTPVGHRHSLTLADGTRVDLNAQTSLQIEISGNTRHVLLASGEAFFSVHKDPSRPFIVESPAGSVRVTGTRFNVRAESSSAFQVTVAEGSVKARPIGPAGAPVSPYSLVAGDQLLADANSTEVHRLSPSALDDALAWRQGQIVFNGVPLRDALARFARYHGRAITVAPEVAGKLVGGRYSLDDLDGFLVFIEEELQVHVTRDLNGTVQVAARPAH